jgi:hypothetical protein
MAWNETGNGPEAAPGRITVIGNVILCRTLDPSQLGWISGKRAVTRSNFPANFEYVDLRGLSLSDLDRALDEEGRAYDFLQAAGFDQTSIDEVDRQRANSPFVPVLDFGIVAAVVAVSALGCVPVTSCRGPTLGRRPHQQPAPMIVFYARRTHVPTLLKAIEQADCQIVNNGAKVEIYADDVRKMRRFALAMREIIAGAKSQLIP